MTPASFCQHQLLDVTEILQVYSSDTWSTLDRRAKLQHFPQVKKTPKDALLKVKGFYLDYFQKDSRTYAAMLILNSLPLGG